jgi:hypothetical protein
MFRGFGTSNYHGDDGHLQKSWSPPPTEATPPPPPTDATPPPPPTDATPPPPGHRPPPTQLDDALAHIYNEDNPDSYIQTIYAERAAAVAAAEAAEALYAAEHPADMAISSTVDITTTSRASLTGTFTSAYMTSGQPGVSFRLNNSCNNNNGCDANLPVVAGIKTNRCYDHDDRHLRGMVCVEGNPTSKCPPIGTVVSGTYTGPTAGQALSYGNSNPNGSVYLQCVYSSITDPFETTTVSVFTGPGASDLTSATGMQAQYCNLQNYNNVVYGPCATFYTNITQDFDYQQIYRINEEQPNGAWAVIGPYVDTVRRIATQTGGSVAGTSLARNMISTYCLVNAPSVWPTNKIMRQIINLWALNNTPNISTDIHNQAIDIINNYCTAHPTSVNCYCWAAYKQTNIFNYCQGKTTGECTDINNIAQVFSNTPAVFAPQVNSIKAAITPQCAVGACVSCIQNASSIYLAPDAFSNLNCPSNIQLCLQSVSIGGSLSPGATINQNCQSSPFNLPASVPNCAS